MDNKNLLHQVKNDILKHRLIEKGAGVVVGISGGADSVCLLKVLKELEEELDLRLTAVHVHHGLRGEEADGDQEYVRELCEKWDIVLKIFRVDIKALSLEQKVSLEEAGRVARYSIFNQVFEETGASCIAVAHQKEDQAETIMLHILRGTGLDGLCGMNMKQGSVIRPLLNSSREQILHFLDENKISFRVDSSNLASDYTRNRIRNVLFPMMQDMFRVNAATQLLRLSNLAREDRELLENVSEKAYDSVILNDFDDVEISLKDLKSFPVAIVKRIIRRAWEKINKNRKNLEQVHVDQILNLCQNSFTGKRTLLPQGFEARVSYDKLIFSKQEAIAHESYCYPVAIEGITRAQQARCTIHASLMTPKQAFSRYGLPETIKENDRIQLFDYDKLNGGITLRNRRQGDKIRPYGSGGEKKLKEYFIDQKIPREKRSDTPLITQENRVIWIIGMRTSEDFRADHDTKKVMVLSWCDLQD